MPLDHTDLREMKKRHDIEGLVNILETGDIKECREAICMLGELRVRKAIAPLIGFLETDDIQIRSNAAWALGEIGHIKAVLPLIGLLNDPIENVRINAAWSLGRIGDKRALSVLRSAVKNGSADLRKHAREAIAKIESNGNDKWRNLTESDISDTVDIPLIAIEVPSNMDCKYISRVEDNESQTDYENMARFSRDVLIRDTYDPLSQEDTRRIILGLRDDSKGLVSVDILFRYNDNVSGELKSSSVWLQMSGAGTNGDHKTIPEKEKVDTRSKEIRRALPGSKRIAKIKHSRKPVEYDLPDETGPDQIGKDLSEIDDTEIEEFQDEKVINKKIITRKEKRPAVPEKQEPGTVYEDYFGTKEILEPKPRETKPELKQTKDPIAQSVPQKPPEQPKPGPKPIEIKPEVKVSDPVKPPQKTPEPPIKPVASEPPARPVKTEPPARPPAPGPASASVENVNSAVQLLSDIGMSGMTNAASTVTQLSGEEAESLHSQLRTLPIDEIKDEITGLGDNVVMIGVELHGSGQAGEVNGEMQLYLSSQNALDVSNELLCNTPGTAIKEFNDDIISTLKETANIFGGQYISAISEYIEVPLTLKTPSFKTGKSSQIAESVLKDITGKVEFALATNIPLGNNRTGHLIMLVDSKSFDIIIQKLF